MQPLQFDYIVGNPPYNKGIVQKHHSVYNHVAINRAREGYIGFFLKCERLLKQDGELSFVTPIKWAYLPDTSNEMFRRWVRQYDAHVFRIKTCPFGLFGDGFVGVTHLRNRKGVVRVTYEGCTRVINRNDFPYDIFPAFTSHYLGDGYKELLPNGLIAIHTRAVVGKELVSSKAWHDGTTLECRKKHKEWQRARAKHDGQSHTGTDKKPYVDSRPTPSGEYQHKVLLPDGTYAYCADTNPNSVYWRVCMRKLFDSKMAYFLAEPGLELTYPYDAVICKDEATARQMLRWLKSPFISKLRSELRTTVNNYVSLRALPLPPEDYNEQPHSRQDTAH